MEGHWARRQKAGVKTILISQAMHVSCSAMERDEMGDVYNAPYFSPILHLLCYFFLLSLSGILLRLVLLLLGCSGRNVKEGIDDLIFNTFSSRECGIFNLGSVRLNWCRREKKGTTFNSIANVQKDNVFTILPITILSLKKSNCFIENTRQCCQLMRCRHFWQEESIKIKKCLQSLKTARHKFSSPHQDSYLVCNSIRIKSPNLSSQSHWSRGSNG